MASKLFGTGGGAAVQFNHSTRTTNEQYRQKLWSGWREWDLENKHTEFFQKLSRRNSKLT